MENRPTTSPSLLMRARTGDEDAWNRLVEVYGPLVFRQCQRKGLNPDDAAEVTQDVFVAVSSGLNSFENETPGHRFLNWLRSIATRKIADCYRRQERAFSARGGTSVLQRLEQIVEPDMDDESEWPLDEFRRDVFRQAVQLMKSDFEEPTWKSFWLCIVEEKTTKEAGELLGMSPGAVRNARYKILGKLRNELGDQFPEAFPDAPSEKC